MGGDGFMDGRENATFQSSSTITLKNTFGRSNDLLNNEDNDSDIVIHKRKKKKHSAFVPELPNNEGMLYENHYILGTQFSGVNLFNDIGEDCLFDERYLPRKPDDDYFDKKGFPKHKWSMDLPLKTEGSKQGQITDFFKAGAGENKAEGAEGEYARLEGTSPKF